MTGQQKPQFSEVAIGAYIQILKEEEEKYLEVIEKCNRKLSVIRRRLNNPAKWLAREDRDGSLRARAALGEEVPARRSNLPGKTPEKVFSEETADLPLEENKTESKTSFGFFKT